MTNLTATNEEVVNLYAQWKSDNYIVYYKWDRKLTHYVDGKTYDLECMNNGDYNDEEKEYMHTFISGFMWHKVYGDYNPFECTRNCNDNGTTYGTCTYDVIQFGSVRNVFYQNSCTIIPNL